MRKTNHLVLKYGSRNQAYMNNENRQISNQQKYTFALLWVPDTNVVNIFMVCVFSYFASTIACSMHLISFAWFSCCCCYSCKCCRCFHLHGARDCVLGPKRQTRNAENHMKKWTVKLFKRFDKENIWMRRKLC